jgi:hypothetical protein
MLIAEIKGKACPEIEGIEDPLEATRKCNQNCTNYSHWQ